MAIRSAAFDYIKHLETPYLQQTFLLDDGTLCAGPELAVNLHGIPLDSALPVVTTSRAYWGTSTAAIAYQFEEL